MSETDEREQIREQKMAELRGEAESDDATDAPESPIHIEDSDHFAEVVADHDVVLVDFYADWCGPCKMLEPVVESIAADAPAAVAKVDVDAHQPLAGQYNVSGVPTLCLFADGEQVEQVVGVRDESTLRNLIEKHA
jgi:thioredoxin 1